MGLYRRRKCGRGTGRACGEHSHRGGCEQPPRALGRAWPDPAGQRTLWAERDAGRGGPESGAAPTGHPVETSTRHVFHRRKKGKSGLRFSRKRISGNLVSLITTGTFSQSGVLSQ